MKKVLLVFSLPLLLILPGCNILRNILCDLVGQSGAPFVVSYPDSVNIRGIIPSTGTGKVSSRGYRCDQVIRNIGINLGLSLGASPQSVYLPSPPSSVTITGHSFDATYGMPVVEYFDSNGYFYGSVLATSVSSDGTSLQAAMPNLASVYSGTYQVKVTNKRYDGHYLNLVGSATMTGWGRDRYDSDGDGWYDDEDCDPYDPYRNYDCTGCPGDEPGGGYGLEQPIEFCPYY